MLKSSYIYDVSRQIASDDVYYLKKFLNIQLKQGYSAKAGVTKYINIINKII